MNEDKKKRSIERRGRRQDDPEDLSEIVDETIHKIHFLENFFAWNAGSGDVLDEDTISGLINILDDLEDDLKFVLDGMHMEPEQKTYRSRRSTVRGVKIPARTEA